MQNQSHTIDTTNTTEIENANLTRRFFVWVYSWMFAGLLTTGFFAYYAANTPGFVGLLYSNELIFWGIVLFQFALVVFIGLKIDSFDVSVSRFLFFVYAALNGLIFSGLLLMYTTESITTVFFLTSATFGIMSIYGYTTKKDLTTLGNISIMALVGIIIATCLNLFLRSETFMWVLTYVGILTFVGLTAYDTQKLKRIASSIDSEESAAKQSVIGALALYLDFINLFLRLLRLFGKRR